MLKIKDREKRINAILYFAYNTEYLGKIKLYKLLFLLDFDHFKLTGRSVTGMEYQALPKGPVPSSLHHQWDNFDADLSAAIEIRRESVFTFTRDKVVPKAEFDPSYFTGRELRLMQELAERFKHTKSDAMIDVTHAENGAWDRVWKKGSGVGRVINYELALPDNHEHRDYILEIASETASLRSKRAQH